MALTTLTNREREFLINSKNPNLGPGSYDYDIVPSKLKKREKGARPPPFNSGSGLTNAAPNSYVKQQFTPGPGYYNSEKQNSSFEQNIIKSNEETNVYYEIKNGTLSRKF